MAIVYLTPTDDGLRLRLQPVDGTPVGQANLGDVLTALEMESVVRSKLGVEGQWLKIRTPTGVDGYAAAWFMKEYLGQKPIPPSAPTLPAPATTPKPTAIAAVANANYLGINLDPYHPLGKPEPGRLGGLGWVRLAYNVSAGKGSEDIDAAYNFYRPIIEQYAKAGYKVMFAVTHQTYGEGKNEFWPWPNMTREKWQTLSNRLADMMSSIMKQYAGSDLIHCWQIWNEQDAPIGAAASVPMSPEDYALLLSTVIPAVRAVDSNVKVITGGHTRGPVDGGNYARSTIKAMTTVKPDGIAFHPYGRGVRPGTRYANWGHIEESLAAYTSIMADTPVWITEWGALDKEGDPADNLAKYAKDFITYINDNYSGKVTAAIWYAWAMGMHNGYGLVGRDDRPLDPLYSTFLSL